jgi:hypothetical protein
MAEKKKWIQNAINPKHKGYCTPMSKKTCTPARKAFARRAKAGKLQSGGQLPGLAQTSAPAGSPADMFPTIDANYDPLDQMGPHAESQFAAVANPNGNPNSFVNTNAGQKMQARYASKFDPYIKDFNGAATLATNIGNSITDRKLKRQEYLQTVRSLTPKFMTNTNQGGLNNAPAYTMFGGPDGMDVMMLGGSTAGDYDYSGKTNEEYGHEGIAHDAFYGHNSIYATGGSVSSEKAKEILRDGTVHGHPITERQRRYFGWIAGGKKMTGGYGRYQTGGPTTPPPAVPAQATPPPPAQQQQSSAGHNEEYYQNSATLGYYKGLLNEKLKAKDPKAYADYLTGLQKARATGDQNQVNQYMQSSQYNQYLSPDEIKKALGDDQNYQKYLSSVKYLNSAQGGNTLSGVVEGNQDLNSLNYGRRFMGIPIISSFGSSVEGSNDKNYRRSYEYNPATGKVDINESGDLSRRPQGFSAVQAQQQQQAQQQNQQTATASRQNGGPVDVRDVREPFSYYRGAQNGGYAVGDEVELSAAEIAQLKKKGYKVKIVK